MPNLAHSARSGCTPAVAILAFALLSGIAGIGAQPLQPRDHEVKAVYLLNFGRFARWPAAGGARASGFVVCVLGRDPFGSALDAVVAGETIGGRPVVARRLSFPGDLAGCQVLFIDASEGEHMPSILRQIDGTPTLSVSDMPRFVEEGGMIEFVPQGKRVRFAVNVAATERAGLTLSSELLRVALAVRGGKSPDAP